ncbi:SDR family oxidoreductase [Roseospira navarrensis]|uniref:SDR family NAD(P)-dependent oxidoreductase n=1 Tax=Roseospira navarrensis TaxID=140058 RepID=A0A7X2D2S6_9PROT|nr:SDR family oxidoreductase [Roseospira navarrensis]MQX36579.1 SDR family NAD(P)-dependent oxidoreductase [Roseospira navarrensis]
MTRTALVTGAGSGIGRAVALALGEAGYRVALCGRTPETLEETRARSHGADLPVVPCDVTDAAAVARLFETIEATFGRLDVLFNNAGTFVSSTEFGDLTVEHWRHAIDVNLTGAFLCAHGAFRLMKRQDPRGGRIINNGSISAHAPRPGSAPYTASKHAITGLTRSIALDGRPYGIACGQIDIGNAATDMTAAMTKGVPQADGSLKPEPVMDVAHVARAVVQMADLPLDANIPFMTIMATTMPFMGRG